MALALATSLAEAQTKPFKIIGYGIAPEGLPLPGQGARPHWIVGTATQLGLHVGAGTVQTDSVDPPNPDTPNIISGKFGSGSPFVFAGGHGDRLVCNYGRAANGEATGTFQLMVVGFDGSDLIVEALFLADFVPVPELCQGKFAGVTGSWVMIAKTEPFVLGSSEPLPYGWVGEGKLNFQK
jgi:hypothetical protein